MSRERDPEATETFDRRPEEPTGPPPEEPALDPEDRPSGSRPSADPTPETPISDSAAKRLISLRNSFDRGESLGRYLVLERLGSGGMGVVYTAYDPQLDRKVALKLLRIKVLGRRRRQEAHQRLVREAQALARLNHPNVVAVHDIGEVGERVFLAMEYVEGETLKEWLARQERPWQEIVDAFVQAGRGLSAAHRAGLLHRDFKPANVLMGHDGRARVLDFGLARPVRSVDPEAAEADDPPEVPEPVTPRRSAGSDDTDASTEGPVGLRAPSPPTPSPPTPSSSTPEVGPFGSSTNISIGALDAQLTRTGSFLGTLAYMSPEQIDGRVEPRSDQFSFCVALYEALWQRSPFIDRQGVLQRAMQSNIQPPPRRPDVPPWLEKVVMRGLRVIPDERYESMDALLDELQRRPERRTRRRIAAVTLAVVAVIAAVTWRSLPTPCADVDGPLRAVWNEAVRARLAGAFDGASLPYAGALWPQTRAHIDAYAGAWSTMRRETCEATRIQGTQSEALLDLRMTCLDQRLQELDSLLALFAADGTADEVLAESIKAVDRLPGIEPCADSKSLLTVIPPADAEEAARADDVKRRLAQVQALVALRKKDRAYAAITDLHRRLEGLEHASTLAQAHQMLGWAAFLNDRRDEAVAAHLQAVALADAGRDDRVRAGSLQNLIWAFEHDPERARPWVEAAYGAVRRVGSARLLARWHQARARILFRDGDTRAALDAACTAVDLAREHYGDDLTTARILIDLGNTQFRLEMDEEAFATYSEAHRIQALHLGPGHPDLATSDYFRANALARLKRFDEAHDLLVSGLAIMEEAYGGEHSRVADYLVGIGRFAWRLGDKRAALDAYGRAAEIRERVFGAGSETVAPLLNNIALIYWESGDLEAAEAHLRKALDVYGAFHDADHIQVLISNTNLARVLLHQGRAQEARDLLEPTWRRSRTALGEQHTTTVNSGLAYGEALLAAGDLDRARLQIETMLERIAAKDPPAEDWLLGAASFAHARLAHALGRPAEAARAAEEAGEIFRRMGDAGAYSLSRWQAWKERRL